jgi:hypothetical protein
MVSILIKRPYKETEAHGTRLCNDGSNIRVESISQEMLATIRNWGKTKEGFFFHKSSARTWTFQ